MSWIPPAAGFQPGNIWSKVGSANHAATSTLHDYYFHILIDGLCWSLTTRQPLWVILCRLPEKGRKELEEIIEYMKERDGEERRTGMKV